jgi:hypothetical protein
MINDPRNRGLCRGTTDMLWLFSSEQVMQIVTRLVKAARNLGAT